VPCLVVTGEEFQKKFARPVNNWRLHPGKEVKGADPSTPSGLE
jgi:hypothetical protein